MLSQALSILGNLILVRRFAEVVSHGKATYTFFYVLLTVHLSIILATDQLNAQIPVL